MNLEPKHPWPSKVTSQSNYEFIGTVEGVDVWLSLRSGSYIGIDDTPLPSHRWAQYNDHDPNHLFPEPVMLYIQAYKKLRS